MSRLRIENLSKKFGRFYAVKDLSFEISAGEILGILGPNGAGKTTTIKMLAGIQSRTSGKILLDGEEIEDNLYGYKKKIGYIPESGDLYSHLSGYEYLMFAGLMRNIDRKTLGKKIELISDFFGVGTDIFGSISTYSKGTAQKILIISAILHNPEILLFDEPLNGLDINTILIVKELMANLSRKGKIVIYSSHILETVEKICTRIIVIHKGSMVENQQIQNFRNDNANISLEDFFKTKLLSQNEKSIAEEIVQLISPS